MSFQIPDPKKAKLKSYLAKKDVHEEIVTNIGIAVLDLSGAAQTQYLLAAKEDITINWILYIYQEASSADAGVDIEIGHQALSGEPATGRATDRNGIATYTSEVSKAQWFGALEKGSDLDGALAPNLQKGEVLTVYNTGGKTGTGALYVIVGYTIQK